jgi:hypothetical protein
MDLISKKSTNEKKATLRSVELGGESFFKIENVDAMRTFFMSIVSDANHWLFLSSNGGISAGRKNPEYAIFPYYTDDKIADSLETTGSKTIIRLELAMDTFAVWEPFSDNSDRRFHISRNLYKNTLGNKVIFEEINYDLLLSYQYEWSSSKLYGFAKRAKISNLSANTKRIKFLDGLQNVLPYGVGSDLQNLSSNLADAYKRAELLQPSGIGIFALTAIIVDRPEPSEALKANVVWSTGLKQPTFLLSSLQLKQFRKHGAVSQEDDVKGERGAYFIVDGCTIGAFEDKKWTIVANVNQTQADIRALSESITNNRGLEKKLLDDVRRGAQNLLQLATTADGVEVTSDPLQDARHYANVLFNIMRGGIFDNNYQIGKKDFCNYLKKANPFTFAQTGPIWQSLGNEFSLFELKQLAEKANNPGFERLAVEYLPLKFSRRHGDPSRPWNKFSINTQNEADGSKVLDYQGNWRDIFQNWEALAHAYPEFVEGMLFKFLNASTFDGYNPYRITKDGFDWETIEPDNPWSYIGYWGDHQIIYLLKFLEFIDLHSPGLLKNYLSKEGFVYANVPYRIKEYSEIVNNPKDTIVFDQARDKEIHLRMETLGADGALLTNALGEICETNFLEKILATLLAKLSNFVPEGGIWMNTQRPEWNDANNALVGNGLSMVTLYYLRRFVQFFQLIFEENRSETFAVSEETHGFFIAIFDVLKANSEFLSTSFSALQRRKMVDALGTAGSDFRGKVYAQHFSGAKKRVEGNDLARFAKLVLQFMEHSIRANKRPDGLYHAYNLLTFDKGALSIAHLSEMLEGQVAVLSSGLLTVGESVQLLDALKKSRLYRPDQNSYILYPNKELPKFLEKNNIPKASIETSALLNKLLNDGNVAIIEKDVKGICHFNGNFRNSSDLERALASLDVGYQHLVENDRQIVLQIFEDVFQHKAFTGRSGAFYAYEGLGSIYWHMVSKLLLAVQENYYKAVGESQDAAATKRLGAHYYDIREGIGTHKPPSLYGAFPTDPYSHTPCGKGAQQPGMTGQVKEDIIGRWGELGVRVERGCLAFRPSLLRKSEFLKEGKVVQIDDVQGEKQRIGLAAGSLCFTYCQVPIVYVLNKASKAGMEIHRANGTIAYGPAALLGASDSESIFKRKGDIKCIQVFVKESELMV